MDTKKEAAVELAGTRDEFCTLVASFSPSQLNTVPYAESWTVGQVVDHVLKSIARITVALYGNTTPTERKVDENVARIHSIFMDFSKKLNSPVFILPPPMDHDKATLMAAFDAAMDKVAYALENTDITATCLDFEIPSMEKLTRLEWVWFIIYHTKRHIHQLKKISGYLNPVQGLTGK